MQSLDATDSDTSVSTFGWDTAYIASFNTLNAAIMGQKRFPQSFEYKDTDTGITLSGTWISWQLTPGGAGGDVQLECLVGTGKASGYGPDSDLNGTSVVIQVNLKAVAADDPVNDPTAKDQGTSHALKVDTSGKGVDPAVSIISTNFPADDKINPLMKDVLPTIIKNYFNDNIGEFNHVFSVMNINEIADKDGFQC